MPQNVFNGLQLHKNPDCDFFTLQQIISQLLQILINGRAKKDRLVRVNLAITNNLGNVLSHSFGWTFAQCTLQKKAFKAIL